MKIEVESKLCCQHVWSSCRRHTAQSTYLGGVDGQVGQAEYIHTLFIRQKLITILYSSTDFYVVIVHLPWSFDWQFYIWMFTPSAVRIHLKWHRRNVIDLGLVLIWDLLMDGLRWK